MRVRVAWVQQKLSSSRLFWVTFFSGVLASSWMLFWVILKIWRSHLKHHFEFSIQILIVMSQKLFYIQYTYSKWLSIFMLFYVPRNLSIYRFLNPITSTQWNYITWLLVSFIILFWIQALTSYKWENRWWICAWSEQYRGLLMSTTWSLSHCFIQEGPPKYGSRDTMPF